MNKYTILGALILAQIALLYFQLRTGNPLAQQSIAQTLFSVEANTVNALSIEDSDGQEVRLHKIDQRWQTNNGFSAQQDKVEQLVEKIISLKTNLAIAHTDAAAQRFQVAENTFQRSLTIETNNENPIKLYLGSGAGARRSHARLESEKSIYSLALAEYELPTAESDWQDLSCLRLASDSIKLIELDGLSLQKAAVDSAQTTAPNADTPSEAKIEASAKLEWIGKDSSGVIALNSDSVVNAVNHLAQLRIEQAEQMDTKQLDERLSLSLEYQNGRRNYRLLQSPDDASQYWIQASDLEGYLLKISDTNAQQILDNWASTKLIVPAETTTTEASSQTTTEPIIKNEIQPESNESSNSTQPNSEMLETKLESSGTSSNAQ